MVLKVEDRGGAAAQSDTCKSPLSFCDRQSGPPHSVIPDPALRQECGFTSLASAKELLPLPAGRGGGGHARAITSSLPVTASVAKENATFQEVCQPFNPPPETHTGLSWSFKTLIHRAHSAHTGSPRKHNDASRQSSHTFPLQDVTNELNTRSVAKSSLGPRSVRDAPQSIDLPFQTGFLGHLPLGTNLFLSSRHPNILFSFTLQSFTFVAGDIIHGVVRASPSAKLRNSNQDVLQFSNIQVELWGFEQTTEQRQFVFLNVVADDTLTSGREIGASGTCSNDVKFLIEQPFRIQIPHSIILPSFKSKLARVCYIVAASATVRESGRHLLLQTTSNVCVLPRVDTHFVCSRFSQPLTASDVWRNARSPTQSVWLSSSIHRSVWVSGTSIFVDIEIVNQCPRPVRKLDLRLEREILQYKLAGSGNNSDLSSRIGSTEVEVVSCKSFKSSRITAEPRWGGVETHSSLARTFELEIPRGHVTIQGGKLFEVSYTLTVCCHFRYSNTLQTVSVTLPVVLVHMSSLNTPSRHSEPKDYIESSLVPPYISGRPTERWRESFHRACAESEELAQIGKELDQSPRKYGQRQSKLLSLKAEGGSEGMTQSGGSCNVPNRPPATTAGVLPFAGGLLQPRLEGKDHAKQRRSSNYSTLIDAGSGGAPEAQEQIPVFKFAQPALQNQIGVQTDEIQDMARSPKYTFGASSTFLSGNPKQPQFTLAIDQPSPTKARRSWLWRRKRGYRTVCDPSMGINTGVTDTVSAKGSGFLPVAAALQPRTLRHCRSVGAIALPGDFSRLRPQLHPSDETSRYLSHHCSVQMPRFLRNRSAGDDRHLISTRFVSRAARALRQVRSSVSFGAGSGVGVRSPSADWS